MTNFQRGYGDGWPDWVPPDEEYITAKEARRKANRAFIYGMAFGFAASVALMAGAAMAETVTNGDTVNFGGTGCTMKPVSGQTHVAEITCKNVHTSGAAISQGTMEAGGIGVVLRVYHGPGDQPDNFIALPPDGYFADPPVLSLNEWDGGVILIYPFVGS